MCNEIKKKVQNNKMCKKNNKMCKKDVQKTTSCAKNNKMYKKRKTTEHVCAAVVVQYDIIIGPIIKPDDGLTVQPSYPGVSTIISK